MKDRSVIHSTFTIERTYPKPPQVVFAAFSDPAKKRRWFAPDEGAEIGDFEMDFRTGGIERRSFRGSNGVIYANETVYQDIVPDRRIVIAYRMSTGGKQFSASLATFEFLAAAKGTDLIFTEQAAFFENADGPEMRKEGWTALLETWRRTWRASGAVAVSLQKIKIKIFTTGDTGDTG